MRKRLTIVTCCVLVIALVFGIQYSVRQQKEAQMDALDAQVPEPYVCALCGRQLIKYHAPCLINLSTGELEELTIFAPHERYQGEISETQNRGVTCSFGRGGVRCHSSAGSGTATAYFPQSDARIDVSLYCNRCRDFLKSADSYGYVLLDMYEQTIYSYHIAPNSSYQIRDYEIYVSLRNHEYKMEIKTDLLKGEDAPVTWVD